MIEMRRGRWGHRMNFQCLIVKNFWDFHIEEIVQHTCLNCPVKSYYEINIYMCVCVVCCLQRFLTSFQIYRGFEFTPAWLDCIFSIRQHSRPRVKSKKYWGNKGMYHSKILDCRILSGIPIQKPDLAENQPNLIGKQTNLAANQPNLIGKQPNLAEN